MLASFECYDYRSVPTKTTTVLNNHKEGEHLWEKDGTDRRRSLSSALFDLFLNNRGKVRWTSSCSAYFDPSAIAIKKTQRTTRPRLKRSQRNPFKNNFKLNRGALHIDAGCCSTVDTSLCCAVGSRLAFNLQCYLFPKVPPVFEYFALFSHEEENAFFSGTTATCYLLSKAMDTTLSCALMAMFNWKQPALHCQLSIHAYT